MSAFDNQPRHQFGDIAFPAETTRVQLQYRHHIHEYPHSPGGAPEKLGRGLYRIQVLARFHDTFPRYPGLYPDGMNKMASYMETGQTLTFQHPSRGSFPAFIIVWDELRRSKTRSGEDVEITFLEDQSAQFALSKLTTSSHASKMGPAAQLTAAQLAAIKSQLSLSTDDMDVFTAFQNAVDSVLALRDTADLVGNRYEAAVDQVIGLCSQLDQMAGLQDARAWPVVDALRDVQAQAILAKRDLQDHRVQMRTWRVPFTQPLTQIATTLLGSASASNDLLPLNAQILDPTAVPAGILIRYYPPQNAAA